MHLIVLIFRAASWFFFFFSFEKRWAALSWREAAIDFYLEAEVKGSLATSTRLNVYWPVICHMVCIFKCSRMSRDHLRAASFSGWAKIESRPVFVLRGPGAFLMLAAHSCTFQSFCSADWIFFCVCVFFVVWANSAHRSAAIWNAQSFFFFLNNSSLFNGSLD